MKSKKLLSLLLAGILTLSTVGCGSTSNNKNSDSEKGNSDKIIVWSLSDDLKEFASYYEEKNEGKEVEVVVIAPADYPTKLTTALRGKASTPDVIVGEPQMLPDFFKAGFFEDLTKSPYRNGTRNFPLDFIFFS